MFCHFHRPVLENYGIWGQLRIDGGSEVRATKSVNVSN